MDLETFELPENIPFDVSKAGHPIKCIKNIHDMSKWQMSEAYVDLIGFINSVCVSIQGLSITDDIYVSDTMNNLIGLFDVLNEMLSHHPPIEQPQRFGNKAFREWYHQMHQDIYKHIDRIIPKSKCELIMELGHYFTESFGNAVRIDYGTGHELSFMFFLCSLYKAEILFEADSPACALRLFNTYIQFVRTLQQIYRMEPAGSQGVWSLDDYQFIPFIFGSAQLAIDPPFEPVKFLDKTVVEEYKEQYMFLGCIDYINQVKTGHFAEHSNQLWSISAVETWAKITQGLIKMYQKEILSKYPIIQHVLFGTCMKFKPAVNPYIHVVRFGKHEGVSTVSMKRYVDTEIYPSHEGSEEHEGINSDTSGIASYSTNACRPCRLPKKIQQTKPTISLIDRPVYTPRLKEMDPAADPDTCLKERPKIHIFPPGSTIKSEFGIHLPGPDDQSGSGSTPIQPIYSSTINKEMLLNMASSSSISEVVSDNIVYTKFCNSGDITNVGTKGSVRLQDIPDIQKSEDNDSKPAKDETQISKKSSLKNA
ncbi:serine/threonine-protein phosphatase 2A activator [Teleopsis dalmanni]|uniref:serine/threonine-protein phosphatase 2A activator n=1 Tax=Teleopsis dalmanni TaxID=139649 RepID=UPI0018CC7E4B|nr:serine/threonine-protein phosphatase 2A activator [Teleopsis dalmanni]